MKLRLLFFTTLASVSILQAMDEPKAQEKSIDDPAIEALKQMYATINRIHDLLLCCKKPDLLRSEIFVFHKDFEVNDPRPINIWRAHQDKLEITAQVAAVLAKKEAKTIAEKCAAYVCESLLNPETSKQESFDLSSPVSLSRIKAMEQRGSKNENVTIPKALEELKKESRQRYINALQNEKIILADHKN